MDFRPEQCTYTPPGGGEARLGRSPGVGIATVTQGRVTTAHLTPTVAGDLDALDLAAARWRVTPNSAQYDRQALTGGTATFKHTPTAVGVSMLSVTVPRRDGGTVTASREVHYSTESASGLFPKTSVRPGEAVKVETSAGFPTARPGVRCRLVRVDTTPEQTITSRAVDFPTAAATILTETVTAPTVTGLGQGRSYRWTLDLAPGETITSDLLPVWVFGDDPRCAPQNLALAPIGLAYPAIYTRPAVNSGRVAPAVGKTYTDHQARAVADWKAQNLATPVGGAWVSYSDYYANLHWVNLDDTTIPRHRIEHWDTWQQGYAPAGWYGTANSTPYPRSNVAVDVPIPHNAAPSTGTDRSLCVVGLRGGKVEKVWELWLAQKLPTGGWRAASIGVTTPGEDWRHSVGYTVAASGISALAYALRVREARAAAEYVRARRRAGEPVDEAVIVGTIPHALAVNVPHPRAGAVCYPATYTDGPSTDPTALWEGQLLYLRPDAPIDAAGFTPLQHVIAVVGKHRGFRVTDKTSWSTTLIVEGDQAYGGGIWATLREVGESWKLVYPDDWLVVGKQYTSKAAYDADTTT